MNRPIYLDYQATTPVDPRVLESMLPYFTAEYGNPASKTHLYGSQASRAVDEARTAVARAIGARPAEVLFTSGATESINIALRGVADSLYPSHTHIITAATEHKAVLDTLIALKRHGHEVTILPVDESGLLDLGQLEAAIQPSTSIVAVMAVNNEIGVIQPVEDIGRICHDRGVYFFCDATQALGRVPIDVNKTHIDLLACSAHKIYGPKGAGALFCRRSSPRVRISSVVTGGGHERNIRSGTLNVPGVVGFGRAAQICVEEMNTEKDRIAGLHESLMGSLKQQIKGLKLNGALAPRVSGNLNLLISGVKADALLHSLRSIIAASTGSACTSAAVFPSHVLKALGLSDEEIASSIRLSLGRYTTLAETQTAASMIGEEVSRLRSLSLA